MSSSPDDRDAAALDSVTFRPVFIIGDHRSGTTLLYQMLAATGGFHVVTAYHVIEFERILSHHREGRAEAAKSRLARRFEALGLIDRGLDGVPVSPDLPEEYGFVIDQDARPRVKPDNVAVLRRLCKKLRLIGESDKPILLKNPWDVLSFAYIKQEFPDAKMVFLHRNPTAVITSQLRAIRSMTSARNPYIELISPWYRRLVRSPLRMRAMRLAFSESFSLGVRIASRHVAKATRYLLDNLDSLPPADCFELRYEDLCANPSEAMDRLLSHLNVPIPDPQMWASWIQPRSPRTLPEVARQAPRLARRLDPYLQRYGYRIEG